MKGPSRREFLPVSRRDMDDRGWDVCDFVFVSGDAYVDHPSFAAAMVGRFLEGEGFSVGIIAQPDWRNTASYGILGRPRYAFLVGSGNMDSMVAHYTSTKKPRSEDAYTPGGKAGSRPDRAVLKYVEGIRSAHKDVPVIIGGIEASLRRLAHYDYWSDTVRRSVLLDSKADILVYGMGETSMRILAGRLAAGESVRDIRDIPGTCIRVHGEPPIPPEAYLRLPDYEDVKGSDSASLRAYAVHFLAQKHNADPLRGRILAERSDERWVLQNPPAPPLEGDELDRLYELPFTRRAHPDYDDVGGIPAMKEVAFSLVSNRGCFGGCSFCAITFHQGRVVRGRSRASLVREAQGLTEAPDFKGYIHDVGGPTANFSFPPCALQKKGGACTEVECLSPTPCPALRRDHHDYLETLRALRNIPGVKKVFVRSGIRFDYLLLDERGCDAFLQELCIHHVSGLLKVAPEHVSERVLGAMGKAGNAVYQEFKRRFDGVNRAFGLKQYLLPYFISGHPGSTLDDAIELAQYLKTSGFVPDQAQDFYPTPGTLATVMYHTGLDPRDMSPVPVPRGEREKRLQRALLQFNKPENRALVIEALRTAGREDLIGDGKECLVREKGVLDTSRKSPTRGHKKGEPRSGGGNRPWLSDEAVHSFHPSKHRGKN